MFKIDNISHLKNGLSGFLSPHQLDIHINKHHQAYVDFLNKNVPSSEFKGKPIDEIIKIASGPMFNNAGQHYNHSFFWKCLSSQKKNVPSNVKSFLDKNFSSVDKFKEQFTTKASTLFGSGWAYLYLNKDKKPEIAQFQNAGCPIKDGGIPLLTIDTWEHAWYIDYENRKLEYFNKFWDFVDWDFVGKNLESAL